MKNLDDAILARFQVWSDRCIQSYPDTTPQKLARFCFEATATFILFVAMLLMETPGDGGFGVLTLLTLLPLVGIEQAAKQTESKLLQGQPNTLRERFRGARASGFIVCLFFMILSIVDISLEGVLYRLAFFFYYYGLNFMSCDLPVRLPKPVTNPWA